MVQVCSRPENRARLVRYMVWPNTPTCTRRTSQVLATKDRAAREFWDQVLRSDPVVTAGGCHAVFLRVLEDGDPLLNSPSIPGAHISGLRSVIDPYTRPG
jgi:hypothetical protein